MTDTELAFASIEEVARLFRKRKLSPVELTKLMLARIEKLNPKLNAYITVTADLALSQAKKAEGELFAPRGRRGHRDRGPLHGIPISLKDNIYTKDIRTTAGSKILKDFVPQHDAAVWTKLKEAGAVLLGKTNLHEFAYGVTTNNPHYGPTRNPWDLDRIPGGSSGGSAAAVAAGLCYASIGTDTGGSIRIPAALCGIVGFKPGIGRVDAEGVLPLSRTLDFVGPLARSTHDAAMLLDSIFAVRLKKDSPPQSLRLPKEPLKIGVPKEFFFDIVSKEVAQRFDEILRLIERRRGKTRQVSIPLLATTEDTGNAIAWAEATHYHQGCGWFPARSTDYGEDVRSRLEMGSHVSATTYLQALETRSKFFQQLLRSMVEAGVDALVVPTTPIPAPLIDEETSTIGGKGYPTRSLLLRLNRPANLAHVPAISIPIGFTNSGLPVGLQLIGLSPREPLLLRIARAFELSTLETRRPPMALSSCGADKVC
jgi:aspartyl-tRNA(Asn)/glutamyl-tRNA(Gln) amidotransferase subunit A